MLVIESVRPLRASVDVQVDEYLPLAASTAPEPLAVCYYTVGNGTTMLAEMQIERISRLVREVVLVCFPKIGGSVESLDVPVVEGLPVIASASVPEFRTHMSADVRVTLSAEALSVDWRNGRPIDRMIKHERLSFLVDKNELLGFVVTGLSAFEVDLLFRHGGRIR